MIEQLANDMVRDHRNNPLLLVMLSCPYSEKKISAYAATGIANAARHAVTTFQPTRWISRKARITTMTGAPLPRMTAAQATSTPTMTACQIVGLRATTRIAIAIISTNVNRVSGRIEDSSQIWRESNRVGTVASVA